MSRVSLIVFCAMLSVVLVADVNCMKCSEKVAEKAMETAVEKATGGKAQIDVGSNVDLSGLPGFLRYPGATAKSRWAMEGEDAKGTVYTFETADQVAAVVDFYKKALAAWKNPSVIENEGTVMLAYETENKKEFVTATVTRDKDATSTSLTLLYSTKD